jgi:hypothetical protein
MQEKGNLEHILKRKSCILRGAAGAEATFRVQFGRSLRLESKMTLLEAFMRFLKSSVLVIAIVALPATTARAQSAQEPQNRSLQSPGTGQNAQLKAPDRVQGGARSFDHGIYAESTAGMCGAIVSYNFSPGDNPRLESVTTCTPSDAVVPQRARQQTPLKSPAPQVLHTDLRY